MSKPFRRLFAALFTHPCRACGERVGCLVDLCESCVDHLLVERRWEFRAAYDARWRDRHGYRLIRDRAVNWLARNPKRPGAASTTNAKETSS